jgi:hypothetical protein
VARGPAVSGFGKFRVKFPEKPRNPLIIMVRDTGFEPVFCPWIGGLFIENQRNREAPCIEVFRNTR